MKNVVETAMVFTRAGTLNFEFRSGALKRTIVVERVLRRRPDAGGAAAVRSERPKPLAPAGAAVPMERESPAPIQEHDHQRPK